MNIFESLENLQVSEACFDEIMGIVEEYINELNIFTVGKVNALRRKAADDAKMQLNRNDNNSSAAIHNASNAIQKAEKNDELSNKYVKTKTGNPTKTIDDVHRFTRNTGEKIIAAKGDSSTLDKSTQTALKDFQKAENRWAQRNPNKPKTGLVHWEHNPAYKEPDRYKSLNLDNVK